MSHSISSRALVPAVLVIGAALSLWSLPASAGKNKCARADLRLARTGKGDRDGDGISNCRERHVLHTSPAEKDTDHDGLDDGQEMAQGCDPHDADSDHDGTPDGDDDTPGVRPQKVEALLDALTCPVGDAAGTITALGIGVTITPTTEFEDTSCADLATVLTAGTPPFVGIEISEDAAGALTATKIEADQHDQGGGDQGEDQDGDDQGEDD